MTKSQSTTCMNQYSHKDLLGNIAHNKLKPHSPIPCNSHGEHVMATDVVSETVLENRLPCGHGGGGKADIKVVRVWHYIRRYGRPQAGHEQDFNERRGAGGRSMEIAIHDFGCLFGPTHSTWKEAQLVLPVSANTT